MTKKSYLFFIVMISQCGEASYLHEPNGTREVVEEADTSHIDIRFFATLLTRAPQIL
jgi:hypothetical protein